MLSLAKPPIQMYEYSINVKNMIIKSIYLRYFRNIDGSFGETDPLVSAQTGRFDPSDHFFSS